jgi:O-antigen/teichoic acid export membrane protein
MSQARTVSFVAVSYLVQTVGSVIFYLIAAKSLPVQEVGAITLFLSFGAIFIVAFSLNLDTGFTHFISYSFGKTGKYSLPRLFLEIAALMMAVSFAAIAASSHFIALIFFHSLMYSSLVILMGGYVSLSIGLGYMVSILQGRQSFRLAALSNMMYSALSMGIPIGMILFKFPVEAVSSGFVIGAGMSFILSIIFVAVERLPRASVEMGFLTRFFAYVTPVYFGALTSSLMSTVDRVILPALTNLTLSAVYTYSLTISTVVTAISFPFSFFLLPKISQAFASSDRSAERAYAQASLELFYYLALPASIGGTLLAKPLLEVLVGGIYASHFIILQIMIFSYSFFSFRPILSTILLGNRKTGVYLYSGIAALGANVFLSLALIPPFGIYGAVVASVSAWAVSTIPRMVAISRLLNHSLPLAPYIRMWINTIIMAVAVFYSANFFTSGYESLIIPVLVGILSYFILSRANSPLSLETREIFSSLAKDFHPFIGRLLEVFAVTRKE